MERMTDRGQVWFGCNRHGLGTGRRQGRVLALFYILLSAFCLAARAADLYVSHLVDGGGAPYYVGAPAGATVTNDLQAAVDLAASGDTVWVEDGFVCDSGETFAGAKTGLYRVYPARKVFIRSRSGDYSGGATIRGAFNSAEQSCGTNAVKGIYLPAGSVLVGFRVEGAASCDTTSTGRWTGNYNGSYSTVGAGITVASSATVSNCFVTGCTSHYRGGGVSGGTYVNCVFVGNTAIESGGAGSSGSFVGCRFEGNVANAGGALYNPALVTNCVLIGNSASTSYGGAVGSYGVAVDIRDCVISNNSAKTYGGALGIQNGSCRISGTLIAGNSAEGNGGGVAADSAVTLANAVIVDSTVTNNTALGHGGGVYRFTATDCTIAFNKVIKYGAGAYNAILRDCDVSFNVATNATDVYGVARGGGLYGGSADGCRIVGNVAYNKGTISGYGGGASDAALTDCLVSNNFSLAGGGGFFNGSATRCHIVANRTSASGGGSLGWSGSDPVFPNCVDCVFEGNYAKDDGGGSSHSRGIRCVYTNNWCEGGGGGFNWGNLTDCIVVCNIASNTATTYTAANGGGIASYSGSSGKDGFVATNCLVAGNIATGGSTTSAGRGSGGGVAGVTLVGCVVTNNTAQYRGGGTAGCATVNCLVAGNTSLTERGGGAWKGGFHYNTIFSGNTSKSGAAGIDGYSPGPTLVNCTVTGNSRAGVDAQLLVNTVSYGNKGTDKTSCATNSCVTSLASITTLGPGNTTADPKLGVVDGFHYVPLMGSPCRNAGVALAWMTDAGDARSTTLNGRARVLGRAPDIGACESEEIQTIIQFR